MNIREMAIEFIRSNPGCSSSQIASGAGIPRRLVQPLLTELYTAEIVTRTVYQKHPFFYRLTQQEDRLQLGEKYGYHRNNAEKLERKGLWRRAAREWLFAMDATKDETARDKAAARREYCISYGCIGVSCESSGLREMRGPATDLWRE